MAELLILVAVVALSLAGWAIYFAIICRFALAKALEQAADAEAAKTTALRLLDEITVQRTEEIKTATARIQALQQQYRDRIARTPTPPFPRRVQ